MLDAQPILRPQGDVPVNAVAIFTLKIHLNLFADFQGTVGLDRQLCIEGFDLPGKGCRNR